MGPYQTTRMPKEYLLDRYKSVKPAMLYSTSDHIEKNYAI